MENANIKLFDIYCSYLFDKLYRSFPKCITINDLNKEIEQIDETYSEEFKKHNLNISQTEKNIIFSETMLWLESNKIVTYVDSYPKAKRPIEPMEFSYFMCISLTLKGLNLLTSPKPKSINKHKKLGEEIIEKVKGGSLVEAGRMITENMFDFIIKKGIE